MKIEKEKEEETLDLQDNKFNPEDEKDMKTKKGCWNHERTQLEDIQMLVTSHAIQVKESKLD